VVRDRCVDLFVDSSFLLVLLLLLLPVRIDDVNKDEKRRGEVILEFGGEELMLSKSILFVYCVD
jgi:hypothetical protein